MTPACRSRCVSQSQKALASVQLTRAAGRPELGAGCPIAADGDVDVTFERWFGDREDAFALALYLQWRF